MFWGFFIFKDKDALFKAKKALERVLFFKDRDVFNRIRGSRLFFWDGKGSNEKIKYNFNGVVNKHAEP